MIIGNKTFDTLHNAYVVGILNVTPDSFSDGGKYTNIDDALFKAQSMIKQGVDIIDVGGESTRPGYEIISDAEEIDRTTTIIERLVKEYDIPISIDTYKSKVAAEASKAGATMINDIWGLKWEEDNSMAKVIADNDLACCIMHNRHEAIYNDFLVDIMGDLKSSIDVAIRYGIDKNKIMLDPGIGFAKNVEENLLVMNHLEDFTGLGYPVLLGTSRKSMIGKTLNLLVDQREEGTLVTTVMGIMKGCSFFRVHNVEANKRAIDMAMAILRAE